MSRLLAPRFLAALLPIALCAITAFQPVSAPPETRELPAFTAVSLGTSVTVVVRQGSPQQVTVAAAPDDLPKLKTEVVNNRLRIYTEQISTQVGPLKFNPRTATLTGPVTVYVTLPIVTGLAVSGSGQLRADSLRAPQLQLAVSGSGQLRVARAQSRQLRLALSGSGSLLLAQLQADSLRASVSGSGRLAVAGTDGYADLSLSSSGSLDAAELAIQDSQVRLSGSGNCQVRVARTLDAHLSSSGNLLVRGTPQLTSHVSGSGRVRMRQ